MERFTDSMHIVDKTDLVNALVARTKRSPSVVPRRLANLYKDLASLSAAGNSVGLHRSNQKDGGRRREARRQAGELLLRQMIAAGVEARYGCHGSRLDDGEE